MVIAGIPREEIRQTRAVHDWLAKGEAKGRQEEGEAAVTLRLLNRRCGPLSEATTAQIQAPRPDRESARLPRRPAATCGIHDQHN
jgi:hypothetical protein